MKTSGVVRVWILNLVLAGLAIFFFLIARTFEPLEASFRIPLVALIGLFAIVEIFPVYLQIRREAYTYTLSEIPLVLGLFFAAPGDVVVAQLVGAALALVLHRRQTALKLVFNLAHFSLGVALANIFFHSAVGSLDPLSLAVGAITIFAATGSNFLAHIFVGLAISLSEGTFSVRDVARGLVTGIGVSLTNVTVALAAVAVLWTRPSAIWALVLPAAMLILMYRAYSSQREKRESLEVLYGTTRAIQRTLAVDATVDVLLSHAREMFRAEVAQVTVWHEEQPTTGHMSSLAHDEELVHELEVPLDPSEGVWARVASEGQALLFPRPIQNDRLRVHFAARGVLKDAMVAPIFSGERVVGILLVGDRLGDVSTFDDEDVKLLETLANHASVSLENARLVDRLQQSLVHLTEMNQLKDDFVAAVSHELRTPLTSIQGYVKTLLRPGAEILPEEQRRSFLEAVDRQGDRLRRLIEDLLVVSRLEAHEMTPSVATVEVEQVVGQVLNELREKAAGREVLVEIASPLPRLQTDEGKVLQIVSNLIDNAFKYSPPGAAVRVAADRDGEGIVIAVSDAGPGIPEELTEKVFDRFYQLDQTSTREVGGTGLGLYICRRLAEALGGRVWIERTGPAGSTFSLWVPLQAPVSPAAVVFPAASV